MRIQHLLTYIATTADLAATIVFRDRCPIFELPTGVCVSLGTFLTESLERQWARRPASLCSGVLEGALDLVAAALYETDRSGAQPRSHPQLRAFIRKLSPRVRGWFEEHPSATLAQIARELPRICARHANSFIRRILHRAQTAEAGSGSVYSCKLNGRVFKIKVPPSLTRAERRRWRRVFMAEEGPFRPGELTQQQLQDWFDRRVGRPHPVSLDALGPESDAAVERRTPLDELCDAEKEDLCLIDRIVDYVLAHASLMRPGLRARGEAAVRTILHTIMTHMSEDGYRPGELAKALGLSEAMLSRIAGRHNKGPSRARGSDLAQALARVILTDERLIDLAKAMRLWGPIRHFRDHGVFP